MRATLALILALGLAAPAAAQQPERLGAGQPTAAGAGQAKALEFAGGRIFQATGFGNTFMVTTKAGNVIVDTSLPANAARHRALLRAVSAGPVKDIILTHSHGDHTGGVPAWREPGTHVIGQANEVEFRNYQTRLEGFFAARNAAQYNASAGIGRLGSARANPGNYAAPPLADVLFDKEYSFRLGDLTFDCLAMPGETPDMLNVWIPELRALFIGDNYYASFPNMYTLRGTPPRPALNYVQSIDRVLALKPEIVLPSHGAPIVGAANVRRVLTQYRDAILYVHDATVRGMNQGKDVFTLMKESGFRRSWRSARAMAPSAGRCAASTRVTPAGSTAIRRPCTPPPPPRPMRRSSASPAAPVAARAQSLVASDPALALRLTSAALAAEPKNPAALLGAARKHALERLLAASKNSNESGWLHAGLAQVEAAQR